MEEIIFLGFNLYAWITIATVLSMFTVLLFTKLRADLVFLGAIAILFVTGVLNAKEAFWWLPFQRLHAHRFADEPYHPCCQYPHCQHYLSVNATAVKCKN